MKRQIIVSNPTKGENLFHAWNGETAFYIYTNKGARGIERAYNILKKEFGKMYLSITFSAAKSEIKFYF